MDDDTFALRVIKRAVDRTGRWVHTAKNREEALAVTRESIDLDLAVVDYCMPNDSGLEIIEALRAHRPVLQAVIWSGLVEQAPKDRARDAGIRWFDKVTPREIFDAVESDVEPTPMNSRADQRRHYYVQVFHEHGDNIARAERATGMKRATVRPVDHADADRLAEAFDLAEDT